MTTSLDRPAGSLCIALVTAATLSTASPALAQNSGASLDPVLRTRARQLTGRSRVIVEYRGIADGRAVTAVRGRVGRKLAGGQLQIADVDNIGLSALAADPRVERIATAVGAQSARTDYRVTGRGIGVVIIDSGISGMNDDLLVDASGNPSP